MDSEIIYIGCYTQEGGGRGSGVVLARRDPASGALTVVDTVARTPSPAFLARHPRLPVLYAVNEVDQGSVSAWTIHPSGELAALGTRSTGGGGPCHLAVTPDGRHLITANYGTGSVSVHPLDDAGAPGERTDLLSHDGHGPDPHRQERAHAHMVSPAPGDGPILVADLGTDAIYRYDLDSATGKLLPLAPPVRVAAGAGPRHLARHPDGSRCYVVGELSATVISYGMDPGGTLHVLDQVPASERTGHVQPSEIAVGRDGRYLYVANRGVGTLGVFELADGVPRYLTEVPTGGEWPRHFALVGEHLYVADERAHMIAVFAVDPRTGVPAPVGEPVEVASPSCVLAI